MPLMSSPVHFTNLKQLTGKHSEIKLAYEGSSSTLPKTSEEEEDSNRCGNKRFPSYSRPTAALQLVSHASFARQAVHPPHPRLGTTPPLHCQ